jgi:hypothetical protein
MLDVLYDVEKELPHLLADENAWHSLYVDYHPPIVERLWLPWHEYRIALHRIHPCAREEALFHPHPWPSAMRVLAGEYEMAVGYGLDGQAPPIAALLIATGDLRYEMTDPNTWHYVRPIGAPTLSLMVTGKPWNPAAPKSHPELRALTAAEKAVLFDFFRQRYPQMNGRGSDVAR